MQRGVLAHLVDASRGQPVVEEDGAERVVLVDPDRPDVVSNQPREYPFEGRSECLAGNLVFEVDGAGRGQPAVGSGDRRRVNDELVVVGVERELDVHERATNTWRCELGRQVARLLAEHRVEYRRARQRERDIALGSASRAVAALVGGVVCVAPLAW